MQHLYAPWRDDYIKDQKPKGCVFCHIVANPQEDRQNGVLLRQEEFFIVMNRYPYTPGHFMVIPNAHLQSLPMMDASLWEKLSTAVKKSADILQEVFNPAGINLGMNIGDAAGAGISQHLHYHIVPRWGKDTNFITTIANTRVYSTDFDTIYTKLKEGFEKLY
ncbi:MAG: HIT family protein [Campylobacterota bacterium]